MRSSTWLLQELILLGGVLIYFTIFVMYFEASLTTCMTQPWFRQIGFALVYGSILIRLYRYVLSVYVCVCVPVSPACSSDLL